MKAIRHTGIVVSNMEWSLEFYRDLLGLKVVKDFKEEGEYIDKISGLSGVKLWMIKLVADDGTMVELLKYMSHPQEAPYNAQICNIGCSHVAFTVEDVDKEYTRLSEKGIRFNSPPVVSPDGYAKVAFCRDPDGVFIELVEVL
ncbi:VOC family protein [candidate division WOR-3 bacterium]|nr:VOC family protein [candidate division WOR-3 bacterium]